MIEYSEWQKSLIHELLFKAEMNKARDVILAKGFDLNQLHGD